MSPEEAAEPGRVGIAGLIAEAMVVPMMGRPPQRTFLHGCRSKDSENELKRAAGLVGAVSEIAMVACGNPEHPDERHACEQGQNSCRERDPENSDAGEMGEYEK